MPNHVEIAIDICTFALSNVQRNAMIAPRRAATPTQTASIGSHISGEIP